MTGVSQPARHSCPHCGADLQGRPIPDAHREPGSTETHYVREIGVEIPSVHDGVLFWACPECFGTWNRWDADSDLWLAAEEHRAQFHVMVTTHQHLIEGGA